MKKLIILSLLVYPLSVHPAEESPEKLTARARKQQAKSIRVADKGPKYESGRAYYDSLVAQASKRHWAIPISFYFSFADTGYNCDGCKTNLASTIFGKDDITIQDLYLFSKLSIENKVRINNCDARDPNRGAIPIPGQGMGAVPFGGFSDDLYTTLLAPVKVLFDAQQKEFVFVPSIVFHYDLGKHDQYAFSGGVNIPIKSRTHDLTIDCEGGELFNGAFVPDTVQAETTLKQFFRDFTDVPDFIMREILGKKGITFEPCQQKTGFGDITLFASFEYHSNPLIEVGLAFVFPTASGLKNCKLWEPQLGVDTFQVNPFIQCLFNTATPYVNPFIRVAGEFSRAYSSSDIRVPRLITNDARKQVQDVPGLVFPSPTLFGPFYVDAFSEFDSCVPLISDKACIEQKFGRKILLGVGNYSYQMFHEDFRLGVFYDYLNKSKDSFEPGDCDCCCGATSTENALCLSCAEIDTKTLEKCSDQIAHIISANLTYKFQNLFEISFGGEFVIKGKNVPSSKTGYFNAVIVF